MDSMKSDDDPTSYFFYLVGQSSSDGPVTLRELLVQIYENWDQIAKKQGLRMQCPISFTEEEIRNGRRQGEEWAIAFNEFENLRAQLLGKEGWVFSEEYDEAMQIYQSQRGFRGPSTATRAVIIAASLTKQHGTTRNSGQKLR